MDPKSRGIDHRRADLQVVSHSVMALHPAVTYALNESILLGPPQSPETSASWERVPGRRRGVPYDPGLPLVAPGAGCLTEGCLFPSPHTEMGAKSGFTAPHKENIMQRPEGFQSLLHLSNITNFRDLLDSIEII